MKRRVNFILVTAFLGIVLGFMSDYRVEAKSVSNHYEENLDIRSEQVKVDGFQISEEGNVEKSKIDITYTTEVLVYNIQKGDTLSEIAYYFEISEEELLELNPEIINPDLIYVGQYLRVYVAY